MDADKDTSTTNPDDPSSEQAARKRRRLRGCLILLAITMLCSVPASIYGYRLIQSELKFHDFFYITSIFLFGYMDDHEKKYPPIDTSSGCLFFDAEAIKGVYIHEENFESIFALRNEANDATDPCKCNELGFYYLPVIVRDEDELEIFVDWICEGEPYSKDFWDSPPSNLFPLYKGKPNYDYSETDFRDAPILIERVPRTDPAGTYLTFDLSGSVSRFEYPSSFPYTESAISLLRQAEDCLCESSQG